MTRKIDQIDRRAFLRGTIAGIPAAAWITSTHARMAQAATPLERRGPRIRRLELETSIPLDEMESFYADRLGLRVIDSRAHRLTIAAGATHITFTPSSDPTSEPFYHFAFNIPENKILAAREWQLERSELVPPDPHLLDPEMPDDVVWFRNWNAHSIFFWDPGGNFVEYIARHTLPSASEGAFSSHDILYASEIGLITDDTAALAATLRETFNLETYGQSNGAFHAVGDEEGLLLAMIRGRKMGFSRGRPISPAPVDLQIRGPQRVFETTADPFQIIGLPS